MSVCFYCWNCIKQETELIKKLSQTHDIFLPINVLNLPSELYTLNQQIHAKYHDYSITEADLKRLGQLLWQHLHLALPTGGDKFNLIISSHDEKVHDLAWECLYHESFGFLAKQSNFTISRHINPSPHFHHNAHFPYRILLFTAQPQSRKIKNTHLFVEVEQMLLRKIFSPAIQAGQVNLQISYDGRFQTLVELMKQEWDIVFLSGHSFFSKQYQSPFFMFESDDMQGEAISSDVLADIFQYVQTQCIVIASCQSTYLATQIAQSNIPHVIGMREQLIDRAAHIFIDMFCQSLKKAQSIATAVQNARIAMTKLLEKNEIWQSKQLQDTSDMELGQWNLPILFTQSANQILLKNIATSYTLPHIVGQYSDLFKVFIGHRRDLQFLKEKLLTHEIQHLLLQGQGGIGKTALTAQLVHIFLENDYRVFIYHANSEYSFFEFLRDYFEITSIESIFKNLPQNKWLIILDGLEKLQDEKTKLLFDSLIYDLIAFSNTIDSQFIKIIATSRRKIAKLDNVHVYTLRAPNYADFVRYVQYLGLPCSSMQIRLMYRAFGGNYKGVQILQSLSHCEEQGKAFVEQLKVVQRYLKAYF